MGVGGAFSGNAEGQPIVWHLDARRRAHGNMGEGTIDKGREGEGGKGHHQGSQAIEAEVETEIMQRT